MIKKKREVKVLAVLGSPRKRGNSATLAAEIIKGAKSVRGKTETMYLHGMRISPCQACYACKKPGAEGCSIDDDMQIIYKKLIDTDALVIASPVYWFTMSAQTKIFMDRCYAFLAFENSPFKSMRIAVAMSFGDTDAFNSGCVNALHTFQDAFNYVGAQIVGMVHGSAHEPGEIKLNKPLMQNAFNLGRRLVIGP
jgi:multimeric flavodoxin WrbA